MAYEAVDSVLRNNKGAVLCKLDIEKVCDHGDWSFLCAVLERWALEGNVLDGLSGLSTMSFFVLINGTPTASLEAPGG